MLRWVLNNFHITQVVTNEPSNTPDSADNSADGPFRKYRVAIWLAALLLAYTLSGFFLVPAALDYWVVEKIRKDLGRETSFEKIQFNPYQLKLQADGFELLDTDGERLLGFDRLRVNFQLSSLFNWAWTFREVSLDGLDLLIERFEPSDSRLTRLAADLEALKTPEEPEEAPKKGLPRLLIADLNLREGEVRIRDHVPENSVALDLGPVNVSIQALNTLPDQSGQQTVTIELQENSSLEWQGSIQLAPVRSEGTLSAKNISLEPALTYLRENFPLDSLEAHLSVSTGYQLAAMADGTWEFALDDTQLSVSDVAITGLSPSTEFFSLRELALAGGRLQFPGKTLAFESAEIDSLMVKTWLNENRQFSLLQFAPAEKAPSQSTVGDAGSIPWSVELQRLQLTNSGSDFSDQSISPPGLVSLSQLSFSAENISNQPASSVPVNLSGQVGSGGAFEVSGNAVILPGFSFEGTAALSDVALQPAQPWLTSLTELLLESGQLGAQLEISLLPDSGLKLAGSSSISNLAVTDTRNDESLLAWQQMDLDRFEWSAEHGGIQLSLLSFTQPYGRFRINEDRSTNVSGLIKDRSAGSAPADSDGAAKPAIVVGGIGIDNGILDFADLSLPLQFATRISDLDGSVSTIDTSSTEPANIRLEGQVDEYGLARIEGSMAVFDPIAHTDVSVEFRNLFMSNLSPYTVKFAGREIDAGKLDLDLGYRIMQGGLEATNSVVLSELELGDEVDSPEAVSLPLDLAVALLKDSDGVIKLDLPLSGDINNPEFEISGVVMQAISTLLTKIVTAPFRLLGSLIGLDSEDLGQFRFLSGRSDLSPPEIEKIQQLQSALQQRPELKVEISGPYNPAIDTPKLQYFRLRDEVYLRIGQQASDQDEAIEMLDDEIRSVLEDLFKERFPQPPLDSIKQNHQDESGIDELAYAGELRDRLLAAESISQTDLETLANKRAEAIRTAFLADGQFSEDRISVAPPVIVESDDDEWVVTELGVATD